MRVRRPLFSIAAALLGAAAFASAARGPDGGSGIEVALAADPAAVPMPLVALLATPPSGGQTSLYIVRSGELRAALHPVATFTHLGNAVRGAVIPNSTAVLAVADTLPARDLSFAATLFRVVPHQPPERLCDRVVHASRPLVTAAGRVFVSRGKAGLEVSGQYRTDELTVDEIDPATGAARTVLSTSGFLTFLAGSYGSEILVYRVDAAGADLVAVDPDTGGLRVVTKLLPFARDFSIDEDAGAVVMQERDEIDSRTYTIDRVDLATGARGRLHRSPSMSLTPFAWPGGGVAWTADGKRGLALLSGKRPLATAPLGEGVDLVEAVSADRAWVAALHMVTGRDPVPFVIDTRTGAAAAVASPSGLRVSIAGFAGGAP